MGHEGCSPSISVAVVGERGDSGTSEAERPAEGVESRIGGAKELEGGRDDPMTERRPSDGSFWFIIGGGPEEVES